MYRKNEGKPFTMLHCWWKFNGQRKWSNNVNSIKTTNANAKGMKLMIQVVELEEGLHRPNM